MERKEQSPSAEMEEEKLNFSFENPYGRQSTEELDSSISDSDTDEIRRKKVVKIFMLLFLMMFAARTDQGIVPALSSTLRSMFGWDSVALGKLGSIVYIGAVTGKSHSWPDMCRECFRNAIV
jgi:uncharacterized protein YfiM (DUF2279 family)